MKQFLVAALVMAAAFSSGPSWAADSPSPTLADMPAGLYKSDNQHTHVYFTYDHVGFSRSHGRFDKFSGQLIFDPLRPEHSSVVFTIDPASIDMNVPELEAVLRGSTFFDVANDREMKFVSRSLLRN